MTHNKGSKHVAVSVVSVKPLQSNTVHPLVYS